MKKIILIILVALNLLIYKSITKSNTIKVEPVVEEVYSKEVNITDLIEALIWVESSNNDFAYHKLEQSAGCLQIRPIMVREVNRLLRKRGSNKRFTLKDRWDRKKSIEMFMVFTKNIPTFEAKARCWNGGPKGMRKYATVKYWSKVKKIDPNFK